MANPRAELEARLGRWGRWRIRQHSLPGTYGKNILGDLAGESAEAGRRGLTAKEIAALPFASLIHGAGTKPEEQDDDTEERQTQEAVDNIPGYRATCRLVIYAEYTWAGTQEQKTREINKRFGCGLTYRQYKDHKSAGLERIDAYLRAIS